MLLNAKLQEQLNISYDNMETLNSLVVFSDNYDEFQFNIMQFMYKENIKNNKFKDVLLKLIEYNINSGTKTNAIDAFYYKQKLFKIEKFLQEGGIKIGG
jgi:hypothetical protein